MANCIDIIVKLFREISPEIATNERAKEFEKSYLAARSKAEQRGHNMDTLIPIDPDKPNGPKTSYNKIWAIDAYSRIIEDIHAQEYIKQLDNLAVENRLDDIRINMQWLEKYYPGEKNRGKRALKAFNSLIFRTNETYGHGTLEGNVDTDTKALFGRMLVKLQEYLPDEKDIVGLFQDTNRTKSFFDEFYHIINQRDWETAKNSQPLTGDKTAFAMAKAFIETNLFGPYYDLNALGKKVDLYDARPKVAFKLYKMKKSAMLKKYDEAQATADKNDFIEFLAERLQDRHGSFEAKKDLATTIFSRYVDNELHDWRIADEIVRETKEFRISEKRDLSQGKITKDQIICIIPPIGGG